ncbi:4Fe-4S dicluster domain-containing protein [uncultured Adlercreutzia sp.]|uniref:4Fe-4S dicluster domain-containing protein n=1 Tax=uncultured Adlercreutzia sp. TaxID=875803 RepID=UPI0025D63786|nr:4Fe-4S dicluster domain-containing protein [uncultured Adlercreutzia sp.]
MGKRTEQGMSRRTLLIGGAAVAVGAACGVASIPLVAEADVLRPPGSLAEEEFMARCIRCERCISVCPTDVLAPMPIEGGLLAVRTPFVTFANDACTFCDECRKVCPTRAIDMVDPYQPALGRIGVAEVDAGRCVAFDQAGTCGICVDACPYEALSFDEGRRPVVDEAKCNGCGECVKICPANVLTSFSGGSQRGINVVTEKQHAERSAQ